MTSIWAAFAPYAGGTTHNAPIDEASIERSQKPLTAFHDGGDNKCNDVSEAFRNGRRGLTAIAGRRGGTKLTGARQNNCLLPEKAEARAVYGCKRVVKRWVKRRQGFVVRMRLGSVAAAAFAAA